MSETLLDDLLPVDLGMPAQFAAFRQIQMEIADWSLYGPNGDDARRFMLAGAPTGCGKSMVSHTVGMMSGHKYAVLTATRSLQDQQVKDKFADEFGQNTNGIVDLRGRSNYLCVDYEPLHPEKRWQCDQGVEKSCPVADTDRCPAVACVELAKAARGFTTNYQMWMYSRAFGNGGLEYKTNPVGMLICDEAHLAMRELARFLGIWVSDADLNKYCHQEKSAVVRAMKGAEWGRVGIGWITVLEMALNEIAIEAAGVEEECREIKLREARQEATAKEIAWRREAMGKARTLRKKQSEIARVLLHADDGNWIWKETRNGWAFECVWPRKYAERYLWSGVGRVVLMSATLRPKTRGLLGIDLENSWFKEWPRVFPANKAPVYWWPTGRMGMKSSEEDFATSIARGNQLYREWREYKGIVHTPSYKLAERIQAASEFGRYMILNKPGEATQSAERYRKAKAPAILVSPSFAEGWDFPDEQARWGHIPKLPFPDKSDPVTLARMETDKEYYNHETMQKLVQACGRVQRNEDDWGVTVITDDAVKNFRHYAASFAPKGFKIRDIDSVPRAPRLNA